MMIPECGGFFKTESRFQILDALQGCSFFFLLLSVGPVLDFTTDMYFCAEENKCIPGHEM